MCPACGSGWSCGSGGPRLGHVSSDQEPFCWAGHVSSVRARLVCIKWESEREFFAPPFCLPRSARPSLTAVPFSLSRRREKVFAPFFCLFLICRLLPFSSLPRAFLRATVISRKEKREKEKGESEGEERTHESFCDLKRDVGLEAVRCEGVDVEGLRHEGVSVAKGDGAPEGSQEGRVSTTLAW